MATVLVAFESLDGQTKKIAERISRVLERRGDEPRVAEVSTDDPARELPRVDAVVLGAPLHQGRHSEKVAALARQVAACKLPAAFFSVSLSAAGSSARQQQDACDCLLQFLAETQWRPALAQPFAGALKYRQYGWLKRRLMQWIARREGGPVDASRDYEFTDWNEVERFAERFADFLDGSVFPTSVCGCASEASTHMEASATIRKEHSP